MKPLSFVVGFVLLGCNGGVVHPEPGKPNTPEYCGKRAEFENDCMACTSQPGCGWCESPVSGGVHCQPGVDERRPSTCAEGFTNSSAECAPPPPPLSSDRVPGSD